MDPYYPLTQVQALADAGRYRITGTALTDAGELGFDQTDIKACVLALSIADFHKSMPAQRQAGLFQDVYRPIYCGHQLYVKVQITRWDATDETVVVISFKRK